jgi:tetratricopeptide (TPR) repeat protein
MSRIDVPTAWSAEQIRAQVWLKWRLADSPAARAVADAALSGTALSGTVLSGTALSGSAVDRSGEALVAALTALALDDEPAPPDAMSNVDGSCLVVAADAQVLRGDWSAALKLYERAVEVDATQPIALIGRAVVAIHRRRAGTALDDLRPLLAARPDDPVIRHYLALALMCRATEVRALSRDGRSVITSAAQLDECGLINDELADLARGDSELDEAATALHRQVLDSGVWTWREEGSNGGVLMSALVLSAAGILGGGTADDAWLVIGGALLGAGVVFLYVVTHRRPAWELQAQDLGSTVTEPDG